LTNCLKYYKLPITAYFILANQGPWPEKIKRPPWNEAIPLFLKLGEVNPVVQDPE